MSLNLPEVVALLEELKRKIAEKNRSKGQRLSWVHDGIVQRVIWHADGTISTESPDAKD
jgi:hypothetical protein